MCGGGRGGGLQSMGLTGEPAVAATLSSAGRVCCVCLTACVCFMLVWYMSVCVSVCACTCACEEVSVQVSVCNHIAGGCV